MPSRISQMLNEPIQQQMPQQRSQQQLNNSIAQAKQMMRMVQMAQDPQAELANLIRNNPNSAAISNMLQNGNSLEQIARNMAQQNGIDINNLINQLQG